MQLLPFPSESLMRLHLIKPPPLALQGFASSSRVIFPFELAASAPVSHASFREFRSARICHFPQLAGLENHKHSTVNALLCGQQLYEYRKVYFCDIIWAWSRRLCVHVAGLHDPASNSPGRWVSPPGSGICDERWLGPTNRALRAFICERRGF